MLIDGNQKGEFENVAAMASTDIEGNTIWVTGKIIVDQKEASIEQITSIQTAEDFHVICNNWTEKQAEEYVTELIDFY